MLHNRKRSCNLEHVFLGIDHFFFIQTAVFFHKQWTSGEFRLKDPFDHWMVLDFAKHDELQKSFQSF